MESMEHQPMLPAICSSSTVPFVAILVHLATHPVTSKCGDRSTERSGDVRWPCAQDSLECCTQQSRRDEDRRLCLFPIRHEWIARTEQEGWADVISVTFSNGQRTGYARGRDDFLEKLAELKGAGSIDDETGVEFTITHTFVNPPKRVVGLGP